MDDNQFESIERNIPIEFFPAPFNQKIRYIFHINLESKIVLFRPAGLRNSPGYTTMKLLTVYHAICV